MVKMKRGLFLVLIPALLIIILGPGRTNYRHAAGDMLSLAREKIRCIDKNAWLAYVEYDGGNRNLKFRSAEFIFNSPRMSADRKVLKSIKVTIRDGEVKEMRPVRHSWMKRAIPDARPEAAFGAALNAGFDVWWKKNPGALLCMELKPDISNDDQNSAKNRWVWVVKGKALGISETKEFLIDGEGHFLFDSTVLRDVQRES